MESLGQAARTVSSRKLPVHITHQMTHQNKWPCSRARGYPTTCLLITNGDMKGAAPVSRAPPPGDTPSKRAAATMQRKMGSECAGGDPTAGRDHEIATYDSHSPGRWAPPLSCFLLRDDNDAFWEGKGWGEGPLTRLSTSRICWSRKTSKEKSKKKRKIVDLTRASRFVKTGLEDPDLLHGGYKGHVLLAPYIEVANKGIYL